MQRERGRPCIFVNKDGNPSTKSTRHVEAKCKHTEGKMSWLMKLLDLVGFDVLFLVIFSELVVKCVVGFRRFVREFWRTNGNGRKGPVFFNVQQNRIVCRPEDNFLQINGIAGFQGLNLFS